MLNKEVMYSYEDISIKPSVLSYVSHRSDVNVLDKNGFLPLFTAPMTKVVGESSYDTFVNNKIYAIMPRNVDYNKRLSYLEEGKWVAFSLNEFEDLFTKEKKEYKNKIKVLIDIANGHIKRLYDAVSISKKIYGNNIVIMVGNIANPLTYNIVADSGADYVRVGIGGGSVCATSTRTAIHMPYATLLDEMRKVKEEYIKNHNIYYDDAPKIIADGNIKSFADVIKALCLGADYVMCGNIFSKMLESEGEWKCGYKGMSVEEAVSKNLFTFLRKKFYGMASKEGQKDLGKEKFTIEEGYETSVCCEYTMGQWAIKMCGLLSSAMTYIGAFSLDELYKKSECVINNTIRYNKE